MPDRLDDPPPLPIRSSPLGRLVIGFALALLAIFAWIATFRLMDSLLSRDPFPEWTSASSEPAPADFLYLMYPKDAAVPIFDAPDGAQTGVLARAMGNSHEELGRGWIALGNRAAWVRRRDLVFLPPPAPGKPVDWDETYREAMGDSLWHAWTESRRGPAGSTIVTFHVRPDDDHVEEYEYKVAGGAATPLSMTRYFGPGWALANIDTFVYSLAAASLAAPVVVLAVRAGVRRAIRSRVVGS